MAKSKKSSKKSNEKETKSDSSSSSKKYKPTNKKKSTKSSTSPKKKSSKKDKAIAKDKVNPKGETVLENGEEVSFEEAENALKASYTPEGSESDTRLTQLAQFLSGEKELEAQEKEIQKLKEEAVEMQKDLMRKDIKNGEFVMEAAPDFDPNNIVATGGAKKVVQKIKLYGWEAPVRVQYPFDSKLFAGIVLLSLIFVLYLAVLGQYGLMFSIIALLFFLYVAGTTEPTTSKHMITTRGVETLEKLYEWYMLDRFWFSKKNDQYVLNVETRLRTPAMLIMLVDKKDMTPIFILLQDKLLYKDVKKQGRLDRATHGEYISIDKI